MAMANKSLRKLRLAVVIPFMMLASSFALTLCGEILEGGTICADCIELARMAYAIAGVLMILAALMLLILSIKLFSIDEI